MSNVSFTFWDREFGRDRQGPDNTADFEENLVGVAMPFEGERSRAVFSIISEECHKKRLQAKRVDQYVRSGIVLRDIAELIERAEFLIFDLSEERPNVYYELGYAHGVGNEASDILLIAAQGTRLHYDIAGLRVHFFDSDDQLRSILATALDDMLRNSRE